VKDRASEYAEKQSLGVPGCREVNRMSKALCPSSPAKDGALLIGVVVGDTLAYLQPAMPVTDEDLSQAGDHLEERFRFSLPCLCEACHNFSEGRCGLIQEFLAQQASETPLSSGRTPEGFGRLPNCPIRSKCQWFRQSGVRACDICPSVRHPVLYTLGGDN
jgi:hypothetical protein